MIHGIDLVNYGVNAVADGMSGVNDGGGRVRKRKDDDYVAGGMELLLPIHRLGIFVLIHGHLNCPNHLPPLWPHKDNEDDKSDNAHKGDCQSNG